MMGLAACSDTDNTTTQGVPPATDTAPGAPNATPAPPPADNNMGGGNTMQPAPGTSAPAQ
jgi:hypothetical protein